MAPATAGHRWLVPVLLAAIALAAIPLVRHLVLSPPAQQPAPAPPVPSLAYPAAVAGTVEPPTSGGLESLLGGKGLDPQKILARPDQKPLATAPAGLAEFPGATRLLGRSQGDHAWQEDLAVYRIAEAGTDAVIDFCRRSATEAGFKAVPGDAGKGPAISVVFRRDTESLLVRARPVGESVRLTVIHRYPAPANNPKDEP